MFLFYLGEKIKEQERLFAILNLYSNCLETLIFKEVSFDANFDFLKLLSNFSSLKKLEMNLCRFPHDETQPKPFSDDCFKNLKEIKFVGRSSDDYRIFDFFHNMKSLQKIEVYDEDRKIGELVKDSLFQLLKKNSNIKCLQYNGQYEETKLFKKDWSQIQLRRLETNCVNLTLNVLEPLVGTLKELKLSHLPFDFDGGNVLKLIFEQMKLETFYYGEFPLIINGRKNQNQNVESLKFNQRQVTAAIEMMRQFPSKF
jgi:hypothetical protein